MPDVRDNAEPDNPVGGPPRADSVNQARPGRKDAVERTGPVQQAPDEARAFEREQNGERDDQRPVSPNEGRLGPAADPAEGKR
ncbi:hypothetical protein [Phenylobacterium sp.]|jgi:hypothetical protein|uniref:hypothetical protein n=1 Tax=Phenylobacterium sp. TaxID=1871053 RepID=UPI002F3E5711